MDVSELRNSELRTIRAHLLYHYGWRKRRKILASKLPQYAQAISQNTWRQINDSTHGGSSSEAFAIEHIFVVLGKTHVDTARDQLPDLPVKNFLVEPEGRDTAPCIGFAAISLLALDQQAVMTLPADHFIPDTENFIKTALHGADIANSGDYLVTIGIKPSRPETGYGYINAYERVFLKCSGLL